MARRKRKIRCYIQGRKLKGKGTVKPLTDGMFVYKGEMYDIEDFPPDCMVNLDKSKVQSHGRYEVKSVPKKKSKNKGYRKKYRAYLYCNHEECPDVKEIRERQA